MGGARGETARERRRPFRPGRARLAAIAFGVPLAFPVAATEALPDAAYLQWNGTLASRTLDDGSVLSEYTATTDALDEPDVVLSVGFVPRFDCTPLIGLQLTGAVARELGTALGDGDRVAFAIDGEAAELALLVDTDDAATMLWFDDDAASRDRIRRRIDTGSRAELVLPDERTVAFSLLGSRRSAAAVETACRTHEPLPYEERSSDGEG